MKLELNLKEEPWYKQKVKIELDPESESDDESGSEDSEDDPPLDLSYVRILILVGLPELFDKPSSVIRQRVQKIRSMCTQAELQIWGVGGPSSQGVHLQEVSAAAWELCGNGKNSIEHDVKSEENETNDLNSIAKRRKIDDAPRKEVQDMIQNGPVA